MSAAATLKAAAFQSFDDLMVAWLAGTLKAKTAQFTTAVLAVVLDQDAAGRPIADWATRLFVTQNQMPNANVPFISGLVVSADQVYRLCWLASYMQTNAIITNAQGVALLAAYNAAYT